MSTHRHGDANRGNGSVGTPVIAVDDHEGRILTEPHPGRETNLRLVLLRLGQLHSLRPSFSMLAL